jgi:hypothetical protein
MPYSTCWPIHILIKHDGEGIYRKIDCLYIIQIIYTCSNKKNIGDVCWRLYKMVVRQRVKWNKIVAVNIDVGKWQAVEQSMYLWLYRFS